MYQPDIRLQFSGIGPRGNSIFVFEVAGLCIGHVGHLHHVPNDEQFATIGRLDVVMMPVGAGMTLPLSGIVQVVRQLKSAIAVPIPWFSSYPFDSFILGMAGEFVIFDTVGALVEISLHSLPDSPTIMVLR